MAENSAQAVDLYELVRQYAKVRGYRLRPRAASWIADSTVKVVSQGADGAQAFDAYRKLIDSMIEESKTIPNYPSGGLGERTLYPVLKRICPLFPIC